MGGGDITVQIEIYQGVFCFNLPFIFFTQKPRTTKKFTINSSSDFFLSDKFSTKLNLRTDRFDLKYLKVTRTEAGGAS